MADEQPPRRPNQPRIQPTNQEQAVNALNAGLQAFYAGQVANARVAAMVDRDEAARQAYLYDLTAARNADLVRSMDDGNLANFMAELEAQPVNIIPINPINAFQGLPGNPFVANNGPGVPLAADPGAMQLLGDIDFTRLDADFQMAPLNVPPQVPAAQANAGGGNRRVYPPVALNQPIPILQYPFLERYRVLQYYELHRQDLLFKYPTDPDVILANRIVRKQIRNQRRLLALTRRAQNRQVVAQTDLDQAIMEVVLDEGDEDDPQIIEFGAKLRALTTSLSAGQADDVSFEIRRTFFEGPNFTREMNVWDIFRFYLTINDEFADYRPTRFTPEAVRITQWMRNLRQFLPLFIREAADPRNAGLFDQRKINGLTEAYDNDINFRSFDRITELQWDWAIEYCMIRFPINSPNYPNIRRTIVEMDFVPRNPLYPINIVSDYIFIITEVFKFMQVVMSFNINVTDALISGRRYKSIIVNERDETSEFKMIQAFPYLITLPAANLNSEANKYKQLILPDARRKYNFYLTYENLTDLYFKVKIKKLYIQINPNTGVKTTEAAFFTFNINFLDLQDEYPLTYVDKKTVWDLYTGEDEFEEAWFNCIRRFLARTFDTYKDKYNYLDENPELGEINLDNFLVNNVVTYGTFEGRLTDLDRQDILTFNEEGTILKPAFCPTALDNTIRKLIMVTESTSVGICLYEAYWTYLNKDKIQLRSKQDNLSYGKIEDRRKLIMRSLENESDWMKGVVLGGETVAFFDLIKDEGIQYYFIDCDKIDDDIINPEFEDLDDNLPTIVMFDSHVICASTKKLKNYLTKGTETERITKEVYEMLPLEEPAKLPEVENYYLDIETSIDPLTGRFTPYLICITGKEHHTWFGPDCVEHFAKWVDSKVDKGKEGTANHHKRKVPEICIWTYNGDKFDLIFLVRSLLSIPGFTIRGSLDNLKSIEIKNLKFRDLIKIVPVGSLRKQSDFWKTNLKKGTVDFDVITDEFVEEMYQNLHPEKKQDIIQYCQLDCEVLRECVESYLAWVWENLKVSPYVLSTAALAVRVLKTHFNPAKGPMKYWRDNKGKPKSKREIKREKLVTGIPKDLYDKLKSSYKGGICYVGKKKMGNPVIIIRRLIANFTEKFDDYTHDYMEKYNNQQIFEDKEALRVLIRLVCETLDQQIVKPLLMTLGACVDINSSYPNIMKYKKVPIQYIRTNTWEDVGRKCLTCPWTKAWITETNLYGVFELEWKDDTIFPTIPKRTEDGLNHTLKNNTIEYVWGCELLLAIESGQIKKGLIFEELEFEAYNLYGEYVTEFYDNRRKECKRNGDTQGDTFFKLLLNAPYGKHGQDLYPETIVMSDEKLIYHSEKLISEPEMIQPGFWLGKVEADYKEQYGGTIPIASYITSEARCELVRLMMKIGWENIWYADTDSLFIPMWFLPQLREEGILNETELGKWAVEKDCILEYYCPCKKVYYYEGEDKKGPCVVSKCKGMQKSSLNKEQYIELVETGMLVEIEGGDKWVRGNGYVRKIPNVKNFKVNDKRIYTDGGLNSLPLNM